MTGTHLLIIPLVGACIGYVTNYIAVKMLFRPYKPVMLGKFRLPFTPGVIPKNKERIARACGNAIAGNLLTLEDMRGALDVDKLAGQVADSVKLDMTLESLASKETIEKIKKILSAKIIEKINGMDIEGIVRDVGVNAVMDKIKGSMVSMFITPNMIESFAVPVAGEIRKYLQNDGSEKIEKMVAEEVEEFAFVPVNETLEGIGIDYRGIIRKVVSDLMEEKLQGLLSEIDIAGIVEAKINSMDMREFEDLVFSIMKKELQAIVNLGALIGLVIGLINLLVI